MHAEDGRLGNASRGRQGGNRTQYEGWRNKLVSVAHTLAQESALVCGSHSADWAAAAPCKRVQRRTTRAARALSLLGSATPST